MNSINNSNLLPATTKDRYEYNIFKREDLSTTVPNNTFITFPISAVESVIANRKKENSPFVKFPLITHCFFTLEEHACIQIIDFGHEYNSRKWFHWATAVEVTTGDPTAGTNITATAIIPSDKSKTTVK